MRGRKSTILGKNKLNIGSKQMNANIIENALKETYQQEVLYDLTNQEQDYITPIIYSTRIFWKFTKL